MFQRILILFDSFFYWLDRLDHRETQSLVVAFQFIDFNHKIFMNLIVKKQRFRRKFSKKKPDFIFNSPSKEKERERVRKPEQKNNHQSVIDSVRRLVAEMLRIKIDGDQEQGTILIDVILSK